MSVVIFCDIQWCGIPCSGISWHVVRRCCCIVGFRPSGVGTAFEQQTGGFLMLWVYISLMPVVCGGMASYHAMPYGRMRSHTIWEAFSIISSLSLIFICLVRRCHMGWCGFKPFRWKVFLIISSSGPILTSFVQWTLSVSIHDKVTPLHWEAYSIISSLSLIFTSFVSP